MNLTQLSANLAVKYIVGELSVDILEITFDSRKCDYKSLFVALCGTERDGHDFIEQVINNGCRAVVCQTMPTQLKDGVTYIQVDDSHKALAELAAEFYGNPSRKLKLVGVTGTNGKTTIATLLYDLFRKLGYKVGLISTVVYKIDDKEIASTHTTPDVIRLNALFAEMVELGCEYCFMEVSSHSIIQKRVWGIDFDGAIFTNITHDHLDYHGTFKNYIKAKKELFDNLKKSAFALYNKDDKNGAIMVQNSVARCKSYSLKNVSDYKCRIIESHFEGMLLDMDGEEVWIRLIGEFNAYNALAIYATARELGVEKECLLTTMSTLSTVSGRFEYITGVNGVTAIVDYAHTPDALLNVLDSVSKIKTDKQRVICVVGCGGNRDKTKRPEMAKIAVNNSDFVIFTSDNPRYEDPDDILADMCSGVQNNPSLAQRYITITNREDAIKMASIMAKGETKDIIVIAGKGHEDYQDIAGVKHHFSDKEVVKKYIKTE